MKSKIVQYYDRKDSPGALLHQFQNLSKLHQQKSQHIAPLWSFSLPLRKYQRLSKIYRNALAAISVQQQLRIG